jgi:hypothetical protein
MPSLSLIVFRLAKHIWSVVAITVIVLLVQFPFEEAQVHVDVPASRVRPKDLALRAA